MFPRAGSLREVYRGRIDDRYFALGRERPQAMHHDLEEAIRAVLADKPVPAARRSARWLLDCDFATMKSVAVGPRLNSGNRDGCGFYQCRDCDKTHFRRRVASHNPRPRSHLVSPDCAAGLQQLHHLSPPRRRGPVQPAYLSGRAAVGASRWLPSPRRGICRHGCRSMVMEILKMSGA